MTFPINCAICVAPLTEPGALMFGPPDRDDQVQKYHLCVSCFAQWEERIG